MKRCQVFDESPESAKSVELNAKFRDWIVNDVYSSWSSINLTRNLDGKYMIPDFQKLFEAFCKFQTERNEMIAVMEETLVTAGAVANTLHNCWARAGDEAHSVPIHDQMQAVTATGNKIRAILAKVQS